MDAPLDTLQTDLYNQLRAAASRHLTSERKDYTLSATALVHEAFLRLAGPRDIPIQERAHLYATAVEAMRRVLLDHAKGRARQKRGGGRKRVDLDSGLQLSAPESVDDALDLDDAMEALRAQDPRMAETVRLRWYGGLEVAEVAQVLSVSERTVKSDWSFARAWLLRRLDGEAS